MRKLLRIPKVQVSLFLALIFLSAVGQLPLGQYLYVLLLPLLSTVFFDLSISYLRVKKLFFPYAAITTGLIIGLLIDPTLAWYKILTITLIAMAIKNFVRINNKHIFNPASTGLLIGGFIFNAGVAWWGSSFQYPNNFNVQTIILFIILLLPLYVSISRTKRYWSIATFLIAYAILYIVTTGNFSPNAISITVLNPTLLFFAFVMLPEPMTSPNVRNRQILYGLFVAVLNTIITSSLLAPITSLVLIPDALILSLLAANLLFFKK